MLQARQPAARRERRPAAVTDAVVFGHISASTRPVSAYDVVKATGVDGDPLVPVQVYRSLDRLRESDQIKRVVALNAFVPSKAKDSLHLLCTDCGAINVARSPDLHALIAGICKAEGFALGEPHLEVLGHCGRCETRPVDADER